MAKYKLDYIWLDGYSPVPNLRTKCCIKEFDSFPEVADLPLWGFDGSSTEQAEGSDSDCILKPVAVYPDSTNANQALVMCEVMLPSGDPHPSNTRAGILDDEGAWFGFEQEYFLTQNGVPLGFPSEGYPEPQGEYYCGVGFKNVSALGRQITEEHLWQCLHAGINHEGINAEVAKGQWEFQIFGKGSRKAADDVWVARFLLLRLCEEYGVDVDWHCKPLAGAWNGSGMHANFSNTTLRTCGSKETYETICEAFRPVVKEHIDVYGAYNDQRLTGDHETQSITEFSYGVSDRGASIRIPIMTVEKGWKGWLEDRRPASNGDPYKIAARIIKTVKSAKV